MSILIKFSPCCGQEIGPARLLKGDSLTIHCRPCGVSYTFLPQVVSESEPFAFDRPVDGDLVMSGCRPRVEPDVLDDTAYFEACKLVAHPDSCDCASCVKLRASMGELRAALFKGVVFKVGGE